MNVLTVRWRYVIELMLEKWDFYFATVNGVLASLFIDFSVRNDAPDPDRPWLLWVWITFQAPRADGLSSSEEALKLGEIEDSLTAAIDCDISAQFVGRITTAGRREFYFYGPVPNRFDEVVETVMQRFPNYAFDVGTKADPDWRQYLDVLFPSDDDLERIKNRHVVESLEKEGDALQIARIVNHLAYFPSLASRDEFIFRIAQRGFCVTSTHESPQPDPSRPFGVTIERSDKVDWRSINDVTIPLCHLALELGGNYDGWETSVEKD
jgi:hypothetical protein